MRSRDGSDEEGEFVGLPATCGGVDLLVLFRLRERPEPWRRGAAPGTPPCLLLLLLLLLLERFIIIRLSAGPKHKLQQEVDRCDL